MYAMQKVNGRPYQVPVLRDGSIDADVLRALAKIPPDRVLVLQQPDGANVVVPPGQKVKVRPDACFVDAPRHVRGAGW